MPNELNNIGYSGVTKTDRGTKIVKAGSELDKNAFLTILAAELANQDPSGDVDSTQYVSQMAQFASMEQMTNLNDTMTKYTNQNLIGKGVTVKVTDEQGKPYTGVVQGVTTTSNGGTISVEVNKDGKNVYMDFDISDILTVIQVPDYSIPPLNNMNGNMSFLVASSFINKNVELSEKDEEGNALKGIVKGVYKDKGDIKVRVELESGEIKEYTYDKIVKVGDFAGELTPDKPEDKPEDEDSTEGK
ncbi:flagellar hook capping FlgD N-terminal domain-containing protein [Clostridium sp. LP20]|uniref:flagellar hook capping FlgD N-terminal domain-containing protein n=1 Tax=Clostridium sp. LP20 TaxID=3418665 RepID=UPI003EE7D23E